MTEKVVIAGAGHAAGQLVASLKQQKFAGQIVLVGDEPYLPYQRPPLSKKFLSGDMPDFSHWDSPSAATQHRAKEHNCTNPFLTL